ncbi:hypothetical protein Poly21_49470 [Allorhodopirellula heiligendammensis]|uniref:Uncharacterized protein n=2 Tax=Allorhodopirellula heiligendammensis TaxID=2714739 RepID=A0A5C6BGF6_9BACT|nr:hypothetical protein Poly21_49470 [Allorhodopirellula heiligendammensis]
MVPMTPRKMAHRIRLRKPWQRYDETVSRDDQRMVAISRAQATRVDVPDCLADDDGPAGVDRIHRAVYQRQFHRPSGIELGQRVLLEVGEVVGEIVQIRVNTFAVSAVDDGHANPSTAGGGSSLRLDLSGRLADHNELEIELESTLDAEGRPRLVGGVNLWILESE